MKKRIYEIIKNILDMGKMKQLTLVTAMLVCLAVSILWVNEESIYGAELTGGDFNPESGKIEMEFRFDVTQRTDIEVHVDGSNWGNLLKDYEVQGTKGDLTPWDSMNDADCEPKSVDPMKIPNVEIEEIEKDGKKLLRLTWDGRIDGIPVITDDETVDEGVIIIMVKPQGYPERNVPCTYETKPDGSTVKKPGKTWTWTQDPSLIVSLPIYIDYKKMREGDYDNCFLMVKGGTSYKITCEMPEVFAGNRGLVKKFAAYMNNNAIADVEVGDPINMIDGNYTFSYPDMKLEGVNPLTFMRLYSSRDEGGSLGKGFTHGYEYSLFDDNGIIRVTMPYGDEVRFLYTGTKYRKLQNQGFDLVKEGSGFTMTHEEGAKFYFSSDGKLMRVVTPDGIEAANLTYEDGKLKKIKGIAGEYNLLWEDGEHITSVEDSAGRKTVYTYEGGNMVSVQNIDGNVVKYSYDENGYMTEATDLNGNVIITNTYDKKGRVLRQTFIKAGMPQTIEMEYDDANRINTYTSMQGTKKQFAYDNHREILSVKEIDKNGKIISFENTFEKSVPVKAKYAENQEVSYEVDDKGRVSKIIYPDRHAVKLEYSDGSLIKTVEYPDRSTEEYRYDAIGKLQEEKDRNGNRTTYEYYSNGLLYKIIDALAGETIYGYDDKGRIISVKNAEDEEKTFKYNEQGYVVETTDAMGCTVEYKYSSGGLIEEVKDEMGYVTGYEHDNNGMETKVVDALGNFETKEYTVGGEILRETDKMGNTTHYEYDEYGNLKTVTDPEGNFVEYEYDEYDRLLKSIDEEGNATNYEYDDLGRVTKIKDALLRETLYEYDHMDRVVKMVEPGDKVTLYTYDYDGRLIRKQEAEDTVTEYEYDKNGNRISETDSENIKKSYYYDALNRKIAEKDGEGNITNYEYDKVGRKIAEINALGERKEYSYDKTGNMISMRDPLGNEKKFEYDKKGRKIAEIDAAGGVIRYEYDAVSNEVKKTDQENNSTVYTYYKDGTMKSEVDPNGNITEYEYDRKGQLTMTKNPDGGMLKYEYTKTGEISKMIDPMGNVTIYEYDPLNRQKKIIDPRGNVQENMYDIFGNLSEEYLNGIRINRTVYDKMGRILEAVDSLGYSETYRLDKNGNVLEEKDKNGNITRYKYNKNMAVVEETNAVGDSRIYEYDKAGKIISITNENGSKKYMTYDAAGRVVEETNDLGHSMKYEYNSLNMPVKVTNPMDGSIRVEYDKTGKTTKLTDSKGKYRLFTYDGNGNRLSSVNRENEKTLFFYDSMDHLIKEKDPLAHEVLYEYDLNGNIKKITDENKNTTTYTYDEEDRIKTKVTPMGHVTELFYDEFGEIIKILKNAAGDQRAETNIKRDTEGNIIKVISPMGYEKTFSYDGEGNLVKKTDEMGNEISYAYDAMNRIKEINADTNKNELSYNKLGKPVKIKSSNTGEISFEYDSINRMISVTNENGNVVSYEYDKNGKRTSITYPDAKKIKYLYDADMEIEEIEDANLKKIIFTKDAEGRIVKRENIDGSATLYDYNAAGLLVQQKEVDKSGITRRETVYSYDDAGNLKGEERYYEDVSKKDKTLKYYYDKDGKLCKYVSGGKTYTYEYDRAGNRIKDGENTYEYDMENRLIKREKAGKVFNYEYDKAGNLVREETEKGVLEYSYDSLGKMIEAVRDDGSYSKYIYNLPGARIGREAKRKNPNYSYKNAYMNNGSERMRDYEKALVENRETGQVTYENEIGSTIQNEWEMISEQYTPDYLSVAARDIAMTRKGAFEAKYVYDDDGERLLGEFRHADGTGRGTVNKYGRYGENIGSDIAVDSIGKVYYLNDCSLNNIAAVLENGEIMEHALYDPWGKILNYTDTDINHTGLDKIGQYSGYTYDDIIDKYYAKHRVYDPNTGRFTSRDPLYSGDNWYSFADSDPLNFLDMHGLKKKGKTESKKPKKNTKNPPAKTKKSKGKTNNSKGKTNNSKGKTNNSKGKTKKTKETPDRILNDTNKTSDVGLVRDFVALMADKSIVELMHEGYALGFCEDGIYTRTRPDGWQKRFGYMDIYDDYMNYVPGFNIMALPSDFAFEGQKWRIELWKGKYIGGTGGEIGVYRFFKNVNVKKYFETLKCEISKKGGIKWKELQDVVMKKKVESGNQELYMAADKKDDEVYKSLKISTLTENGKRRLFKVEGNEWWLTGFMFDFSMSPKENLILDFEIHLKDKDKAEYFIKALSREAERRKTIMLEYYQKAKEKELGIVKGAWR